MKSKRTKANMCDVAVRFWCSFMVSDPHSPLHTSFSLPGSQPQAHSHLFCAFLHGCQVISVMSDSATLWTVAHQAPLGFSSQEYWSGLPCSPSGHLPNPRIEPGSITSATLAGGFLTSSTTWEAQTNKCRCFKCFSFYQTDLYTT